MKIIYKFAFHNYLKGKADFEGQPMSRKTYTLPGIVAVIAAFALIVSFHGCRDRAELSPEEILQNGDIIFQKSMSAQSHPIMVLTGSPYTHTGIIYRSGGELLVYEAAARVQFTPFEKWIKRGAGGHYVVKRLKKEKFLTYENLLAMKKKGEQFYKKPYDIYFKWDDTEIYCSELVWKIYEQGMGVKLSLPEKFSDFDFTDPAVRELVKKRYPAGLPLDEPVVTPASLFDSPLLKTVLESEGDG